MTLPMSRARGRAGRGDRLVDERGELGLGRAAAGRYSARIAISASSLAARSSRPPVAERLDRLAAGLDLARQDGQVLVVGQRRGPASSRRCRRRSRPSAGRRDAARHRRASRRRCRPGCDLEGTPVWHLGRAGHRDRGGPPMGPRGTGAAGRAEARSADLRSGVLLALRFLALALHGGLLVVLAPASLGEDAALLDLLVEAAQGAFERLVLTHSDFCQSRFTSSGSRSCAGSARSEPPATRIARPGPMAAPLSVTTAGWQGRRSIAEPSRGVKPLRCTLVRARRPRRLAGAAPQPTRCGTQLRSALRTGGGMRRLRMLRTRPRALRIGLFELAELAAGRRLAAYGRPELRSGRTAGRRASQTGARASSGPARHDAGSAALRPHPVRRIRSRPVSIRPPRRAAGSSESLPATFGGDLAERGVPSDPARRSSPGSPGSTVLTSTASSDPLGGWNARTSNEPRSPQIENVTSTATCQPRRPSRAASDATPSARDPHPGAGRAARLASGSGRPDRPPARPRPWRALRAKRHRAGRVRPSTTVPRETRGARRDVDLAPARDGRGAPAARARSGRRPPEQRRSRPFTAAQPGLYHRSTMDHEGEGNPRARARARTARRATMPAAHPPRPARRRRRPIRGSAGRSGCGTTTARGRPGPSASSTGAAGSPPGACGALGLAARRPAPDLVPVGAGAARRLLRGDAGRPDPRPARPADEPRRGRGRSSPAPSRAT